MAELAAPLKQYNTYSVKKDSHFFSLYCEYIVVQLIQMWECANVGKKWPFSWRNKLTKAMKIWLLPCHNKPEDRKIILDYHLIVLWSVPHRSDWSIKRACRDWQDFCGELCFLSSFCLSSLWTSCWDITFIALTLIDLLKRLRCKSCCHSEDHLLQNASCLY